MAWISNHIHVKVWGVITHPCPYFNGVLVKPSLKLRHGWIIIPLVKILCIHWKTKVPLRQMNRHRWHQGLSLWQPLGSAGGKKVGIMRTLFFNIYSGSRELNDCCPAVTQLVFWKIPHCRGGIWSASCALKLWSATSATDPKIKNLNWKLAEFYNNRLWSAWGMPCFLFRVKQQYNPLLSMCATFTQNSDDFNHRYVFGIIIYSGIKLCVTKPAQRYGNLMMLG